MLCDLCLAEARLTGEALPAPAPTRTLICEACGRAEPYDPMKSEHKGWFCDECGKVLCSSCAAYCVHKDFPAPKVLCKLCRAEMSLTGQPVTETQQPIERKG